MTHLGGHLELSWSGVSELFDCADTWQIVGVERHCTDRWLSLKFIFCHGKTAIMAWELYIDSNNYSTQSF